MQTIPKEHNQNDLLAVLPTTDGSGQGTGRESIIYENRFSPSDEQTRAVVWKVLCSEFLQQYVPPNSLIVDVGAGDGYFITNIQARRRIAVDLSPHSLKLRAHGVEVLNIPATEFARYLNDKPDVVFMSNFLEHLLTKRQVLEVLDHCFSALKSGGRIIILQPNIRYVGPAYWDYIDHHIALTEWSLVEALETCGFSIERLIPRFLPYTVKSKAGRMAGSGRVWMARLYLKLPILWRFFGRQTLVIAKKP